MKKQDVIRAWKDEAFRQKLTKEELAKLPKHPAGAVELNKSELEQIAGGGTDVRSFCFCAL